jgi:hypothetical protein
MDIQSTIVATVTSAKGVVMVRTAEGITKPVSAGDQLHANDTLITGAGAEVEIDYPDYGCRRRSRNRFD